MEWLLRLSLSTALCKCILYLSWGGREESHTVDVVFMTIIGAKTVPSPAPSPHRGIVTGREELFAGDHRQAPDGVCVPSQGVGVHTSLPQLDQLVSACRHHNSNLGIKV